MFQGYVGKFLECWFQCPKGSRFQCVVIYFHHRSLGLDELILTFTSFTFDLYFLAHLRLALFP